CVHNSCRSQMAEGFAKYYGQGIMDVYSAGTENYHEVKPLAVEVMNEVNISLENQKPKLLDEIPIPDILITMGCEAKCPWLPNEHQEDWGLEDPSGLGIEAFRKTRELIRQKVLELIDRIKDNRL